MCAMLRNTGLLLLILQAIAMKVLIPKCVDKADAVEAEMPPGEQARLQTEIPENRTTGLKNVSLEVIPSAVQRGQLATLRCHYDTEEAPLYSVKWYRGRHEFYRYSPSELPNNKIFPFGEIHVDLSQSNASQVVLRNVGFSLSGNFSCEVTTDAPLFSTKVVSQHMIVVVLPESRPAIFTEKDRYDPGDVLRANCSSPPSKPATMLTFILNNIPQAEMGLARQHPADDLFWSDLYMELTLQPHHYTGGRLILKCLAEVNSLYQESVEVQLGPRAGDPIPERVRSPNGVSRTSASSSTLHLIMLVIVYCVIR